jgi:hypothetical protein
MGCSKTYKEWTDNIIGGNECSYKYENESRKSFVHKGTTPVFLFLKTAHI